MNNTNASSPDTSASRRPAPTPPQDADPDLARLIALMERMGAAGARSA